MGAETRWIAMGLLLAAVFQRDASAAGSTPKTRERWLRGRGAWSARWAGDRKKERNNSEGEETRRREKKNTMHVGFSYVGLCFLLMLFVPNLLWTKHMPKDYLRYAANENKILLVLERIGEVTVTGLLLIFRDFNVQGLEIWLLWLIGAFVLMLLYEGFWIRYFRSDKTMEDFYCSLLGIPVPGATLPVIAVMLLALYGRNPFLFAAGGILGIGHIGIHLNHKKEIAQEKQKEKG